MSNIPTSHISCENESEIAKLVLMPGDPLRAKHIAEEYLEDVICFNSVRGILGYTGIYKGKRVSVMASGMGMPSIGIYSYELFKFYDVDTIVRIGSAGALASSDLNLYDVTLVSRAYSDSSFALVAAGDDSKIMYPDGDTNERIKESAKNLNIELREVTNYSSDVFYNQDLGYMEGVNMYGCETVEMEAFALFTNAKITGKRAACLLTISDTFKDSGHISSKEREKCFGKMIEIALGI